MITRADSAQGSAEPSDFANFIWLTILTLAGVGGSLIIACVTPFVALAVACAGTVRLAVALRAIAVVWLANQLIGFVFFHFPRTANSVGWGLVTGAAALLATLVAATVIRSARPLSILLRLALAFAFGFAAYEATHFGAALFLGGRETFSLVVIKQLGLVNIAWLIGLVLLNEVISILCKSWIGPMPRLAKAS